MSHASTSDKSHQACGHNSGYDPEPSLMLFGFVLAAGMPEDILTDVRGKGGRHRKRAVRQDTVPTSICRKENGLITNCALRPAGFGITFLKRVFVRAEEPVGL